MRDDLYVIVCKTEYDAWQKDQKPVPALFLYMNGLRMKGPDAARPMPATDQPSDEVTTKVEADCAEAAKKEAADKATTAKDAADKASAEPDPVKKAAEGHDATEK